jgi:hypothetical protein
LATGTVLSQGVLVEFLPMLVVLGFVAAITSLLEWLTRNRPTHWHVVGEAVAVTMLLVSTGTTPELGAYLAVPPIAAGVRHGLVTTLNVTLVSGVTAAASVAADPQDAALSRLGMLAPKFISGLPELKGGDAAALVGGTAALMMLVATFAADGARAMHTAADHIIDGLVFSFRAMGTILPIAGFFFLGAPETAGPILGLPATAAAPGLLFELIRSVEHLIPHSPAVVAFAVLVVGMITGIDGSGFSGLPLTGALAGALGPVVRMDPTALAAVGQMGAVWTGGGTLIAWSSLIAVAGFARVPVLELVRVLFLPVITGLILSTILAAVLW